jgi:hypothetical protein
MKVVDGYFRFEVSTDWITRNRCNYFVYCIDRPCHAPFAGYIHAARLPVQFHASLSLRLLLDQRDSLRSRCCSNNHGHAGQITLFPHPPGREASHWHVDLGPHVSGWYYFSGRCRSPLPASSGTRGLSRIRRRIRNLPSISPPFFHSITREQEESQVREGVSVHLIFLVSVRVLFLRVCVLSRSGCVSKARSVCVWNLLRPDRGSLFKQFWVPIPDLSWLCPSIDSFFSFLCSFRV